MLKNINFLLHAQLFSSDLLSWLVVMEVFPIMLRVLPGEFPSWDSPRTEKCFDKTGERRALFISVESVFSTHPRARMWGMGVQDVGVSWQCGVTMVTMVAMQLGCA